ncbi:MAG: nucleoside triphosphate pyrophosphatase [Gammaproteobacteria bacterium]|nr:nucleoside triphosphate pyrophosphatase [Gammaproteobacteria bacterium]
MELILASSSKSRFQILSKLQLPFAQVIPDIDESVEPNEKPLAHVLRLATQKAQKVAESHPNALIVGADSVAILNNEIVSKPASHEDAVRQLHHASGNSIYFHTGLALVNSNNGRIQTCVETIKVHFKQLSLASIEAYLEKDKPYDCAGSIKAEGLGIALIEKFDCEDPNSLIGLPLIKLISMLEKEGFIVI